VKKIISLSFLMVGLMSTVVFAANENNIPTLEKLLEPAEELGQLVAASILNPQQNSHTKQINLQRLINTRIESADCSELQKPLSQLTEESMKLAYTLGKSSSNPEKLGFLDKIGINILKDHINNAKTASAFVFGKCWLQKLKTKSAEEPSLFCEKNEKHAQTKPNIVT